MKRIIFILTLLLSLSAGAFAQRFAFIDTEYILKNIPAYEKANRQLEQQSKRWQAEIETKQTEIQNLYKQYRQQALSLSAEQKQQQEETIVAREKALQELRKKYFGTDGELFKRREALIKPIYDDIYNAVKEIATQHDIHAVVDRASATSVIFASPQIDISENVLEILGYSK